MKQRPTVGHGRSIASELPDREQQWAVKCKKTTVNNCFLMLSHLKIHVTLFMHIVVVMLLCSMLGINDDVLCCIVLLRPAKHG